MTRRPASFDEADENLEEMLDSLSGADNYIAYINDLCQPHFSGRILEIGAGNGDLTELFGRDDTVVATDISDRLLDHLSTRFADSPQVQVRPYDALADDAVTGEERGAFGSAVMINVLEHLDDDVDALRRISGQLAPGGRLVVFVPAFDLLYSNFDRSIGHHRRYRRASLDAAFEAAGLRPLGARYVNLPGWFAWLLMVRLADRPPTDQRMVKLYDRTVIPVLRRIEGRFAPPFGQSVFGVGVKD